MTARRYRCVCLSTMLDLKAIFGGGFARHAPQVDLLEPEEALAAPETVDFALAWKPAPDAFRPFPNLAFVSSIAAGVDNILACPSLPPGLPVLRVRDDDQARMMAGFAAWHVLWHHRGMATYIAQQRVALWRRVMEKRPAGDVRVAVLGFGHMGRVTAGVLAGLGYDVRALARRAPDPALVPDGVTIVSGPDGTARIAARADMLINLLPLTDDTRGILSGALFDRMPMGSVLIQLGRGEHLVEDDLTAALDSGRIAAASLDVFAVEPLPPEHRFWHDPRILITPHEASEPNRDALARHIAAATDRLEAGELIPTMVDRQAGY
ncbi:glyoxylate/hydroxypyruvate reductase A [Tistrella bauzanensis]|uniref:Glyoxylate/hydroxypyruvate reductase A n=1 Tax=Tistrella bauzanensis TaxID=657419 RepID=A0ABQ1IZ39_9PROT|nr:glyoxylate/hydroxypyruvate reductase A [Tistrella bauzanensis]GGB55903.1 glyoxylate/hydroxypyruvate reductase A [Tistrella bauzanensis]